MGMRNFAWVKLLASVLIWLTTAIAAPAWAQSACTAMWGIVTNAGGNPTALGYYNNSAGTAAKFTTLSFALTGGTSANALAGDPNTGLLYYFDRTPAALQVHSVNLNTYVDTAIGTIAPASAGGNANILGALVDASGNLIMMSSNASGYQLAIVNKTGTTTAAVWRTVTLAIGGGLPPTGQSGDIYIDQTGQTWLVSNTVPASLYPLNITIAAGAITSVTAGTATNYTPSPASIGGVSVNPVGGAAYFGGLTANQSLYSFTPGTANSSVLVDATSNGVTDMGNCVVAPGVPSVNKSFSPTYQPLTGGTTTLILSLTNSNSVPIWLNSSFTDTFPAGMLVAATPNLNLGACAPIGTTVTNVITATAGAGALTFAAGGRIPAGGCTISVVVTAPSSPTAYTNTIAPGALSTTSGSNATTATAVFKVGTDFSASKSQCAGICGTPVTTTVSLGSGQTMQYVLTIANSSVGGTGSATFTDTLPAALTPVLNITAGAIGGGTCTTATAVVGGATQISGTFANAPAGAQCLITVTALVSAQATANTVTNTLTIATTAGTSDTNPANNTAAVLTNLGPATLLTITKTNNTSTVAAGSTTSYTITVANFGPANATSSIVKDPIATGLNCTAATCAVTAGTAVCPGGTPAALMTALQSAGGVSIPTFNAGSTLSFVVTCGVTATGQ
jgi:uncharacterized repeat protein (TIGR01451 family)